MAQSEDTELRDLVLEALEKNGSLAKIRALLRANVFLAFEDECENVKHNVSLDSILKQPEGVLCLSIIHEFLEFCNLKNTLFVYMSESRQRKEYDYEGQAQLAEKLRLSKKDDSKEPILMTLLKSVLKSSPRKYQLSEIRNHKTHEKCENNYKDDQNCTYIVHEDSSGSTTTNSQSDHSDRSDSEKNKLHLRLQLDNSDTDTSSDSAREKSASEYIPSQHLTHEEDNKNVKNETVLQYSTSETQNEINLLNYSCNQGITNNALRELQLLHNSSSDSTSYLELKPYNALDKKLLNTTGIPIAEVDERQEAKSNVQLPKSTSKIEQQNIKIDSTSSTSISSGSSISVKKDHETEKESLVNCTHSISGKSETADYSNDFTSSLKTKDIIEIEPQSPQSVREEYAMKGSNKNSDSENQHSQSSQSSVSISDVADLLSERSSFAHQTNNGSNLSENRSKSISGHSKNKSNNDQNRLSDESVDFSESPVPSLSNLSLDIHSD